jgi:hypothetical protein
MSKTKILTPEFRVSFPKVFKPEAGMNGEGPEYYSLVMLFPKTADLSALKAAHAAAIKEKWGDKKPANLRSPFRDGDEKELDGYEGTIYITVKSKDKPGLVNAAKEKIVDEAEFYAGCYARATLSCYAYEKNGNRGVSFGLQNIQKLRDGEPFGSKRKAEDDFDAVEGAQKSAAAEDFG